ncbi:MAG: 16S rRNA (cytosine(967)-C(5))-methyltransferase RsmB [Lachnobacterium sp.]|nr:16S rRNA (cytosine(967)-C(5))-methyltransferase RsmB [Lachnobacterium sp.]
MTDSVNTRELVLEMLIEIIEKNQYSHLILRDVLDKYQYLSKQERAFMTRLTEGTLEHLIELDYIIDSYSKTKVRKMKPMIRSILRMSVYQIKYMDSVPDSAVCNEAVKLARRHGFGQLSGFVNGVLRNISRNISDVRYPDQKDMVRFLEVKYSMPQWIVKQWINDYGMEKTEQILKGFDREKLLSIRTNTLKCTPEELRDKLKAEGVTVEPVKDLDYAFYISGFDYLNSLQSFEDGLFYVQDVSSMMASELAAPKENDYVIDVCAAPGGKSTHLAEKLKGTGMVEARDLTDYKVDLIRDNIDRHELHNMKAVLMDATRYDEASVNKADVLICDLPCSGLGVLGRKTDIRYKISPEQEKELMELQRQILDTVHKYVKPGGTLVYSTCTIDKMENEDNVRWFADRYKDFALKEERQLLPGQLGGDGFFLAKFIREK